MSHPYRIGHNKLSDTSPINDPLINQLAEKYGKNPAQIMLRLQLQRGIVVIPKSTNKQRMKSNMEVFDFQLSSDEMEALLQLDKGEAGRTIPAEEIKNHK
ncbi:unnamed protein product, partial [Nesidiocoris tenuis]